MRLCICWCKCLGDFHLSPLTSGHLVKSVCSFGCLLMCSGTSKCICIWSIIKIILSVQSFCFKDNVTRSTKSRIIVCICCNTVHTKMLIQLTLDAIMYGGTTSVFSPSINFWHSKEMKSPASGDLTMATKCKAKIQHGWHKFHKMKRNQISRQFN